MSSGGVAARRAGEVDCCELERERGLRVGSEGSRGHAVASGQVERRTAGSLGERELFRLAAAFELAVVDDAEWQHNELSADREPGEVRWRRLTECTAAGRPRRHLRPDLRAAAESRRAVASGRSSLSADVEEMTTQTLVVRSRHARTTAQVARAGRAPRHWSNPARGESDRHCRAARGSARDKAGSRQAPRRP
jgi:hypothetical protein